MARLRCCLCESPHRAIHPEIRQRRIEGLRPFLQLGAFDFDFDLVLDGVSTPNHPRPVRQINRRKHPRQRDKPQQSRPEPMQARFSPTREQRTRYAITLHEALCFHRRCWTRRPHARPAPSPPGMAHRRRGHALAARTARAAVGAIGAGTPFAALTRHILDADVILLAVPDDALAEVARNLARLAGASCRGKIILHTSGALDSHVLRPLAQQGAYTGSLHPMQTFTGRTEPELNGTIFAIEGHPRARRAAREIARSLGGGARRRRRPRQARLPRGRRARRRTRASSHRSSYAGADEARLHA